MANKNISGLVPATTPLTGTEKFPLWDGTKTAWALVSAIGPALKAYFDSVTTTLSNKTLTSPSISSPSFSGAVQNSDSRYYGTNIVAVPSLNTPVKIPGGVASGMLRLRDNSLGGAAVYLVDPNGGNALMSANQMPTVSISTAADYSIELTITSGPVPRLIAWTFYG